MQFIVPKSLPQDLDLLPHPLVSASPSGDSGVSPKLALPQQHLPYPLPLGLQRVEAEANVPPSFPLLHSETGPANYSGHFILCQRDPTLPLLLCWPGLPKGATAFLSLFRPQQFFLALSLQFQDSGLTFEATGNGARWKLWMMSFPLGPGPGLSTVSVKARSLRKLPGPSAHTGPHPPFHLLNLRPGISASGTQAGIPVPRRKQASLPQLEATPLLAQEGILMPQLPKTIHMSSRRASSG